MNRTFSSAVAIALMAAGCTPPGSALDQPPPPPPRPSDHFTTSLIQSEVEDMVQEQLGAETLAAARGAATSIMASSYQGRFDSGGPRLEVLVRAPDGWTSWKSGRASAVPADVGAAIERLLADSALWREEPFYPAIDCPDAGATMLVIRHGGRTRVTRQGCTPAGLTGKLEEVVLSAP